MSTSGEEEEKTCLGEFYGISHAVRYLTEQRMYRYFTAPARADNDGGVSQQPCNLV